MTVEQKSICIYRASSLLEANVVKGLLTGEGVEVHLQGEHLMGAIGELPPTDVTIGVMIPIYKQTVGVIIIDQYLANQTTVHNTDKDWCCSGCGETNTAQFEICWNCQRDSNDQ
jgi:hypothetical protein